MRIHNTGWLCCSDPPPPPPVLRPPQPTVLLRRRRSCGVGPWVRWTSTGLGKSIRYRGPSGTASRRPTASRSGPGASSGSGTSKVRSECFLYKCYTVRYSQWNLGDFHLLKNIVKPRECSIQSNFCKLHCHHVKVSRLFWVSFVSHIYMPEWKWYFC